MHQVAIISLVLPSCIYVNSFILFVHEFNNILCYLLTVSSVPPPKPNTRTPAYIIYVVIGFILFVAGFLAGMFVICIIVLCFKLQKREPVLDTIPLSGKFIVCMHVHHTISSVFHPVCINIPAIFGLECKNKSKVNDR